jgi:hypothetical protein
LTTASDHKDIAKEEEEEEQDVGIVDRFHSLDQTTNPEFFIKFVDEGNRLETVKYARR